MNAFIIDSKQKIYRCHFAGVNEKGEPQWVTIDQGKEPQTLGRIGRECCYDPQFKVLCVEGENPSQLTLMRILASTIKDEMRGDEFAGDGVMRLIRNMDRHDIAWSKEKLLLHFCIGHDIKCHDVFSLSMSLGYCRERLTYVTNVKDLDKLMEIIRDFCSLTAEELDIDEPLTSLDISEVKGHTFREEDLAFFDWVIKEK